MENYKGKSNLVLIGMPGAGKSTVGVILAKILGFGFLDADLLIQEQEGRLLRDIISEKGVDGFLAVENRVNASIKTRHTVIATGGSAVYGREAMEHLRENGLVIYLRLSYQTLAARLDNIRQRGVVLKEGQSLPALYEERRPLYEKYADIIVDAEGMEIEATVDTLVRKLKVEGF